MTAITVQEQGALVAQAPAGPMGAAIQALQAGMTIEQMQGLMGLQKDWETNEARKAYVSDMAAFKLNPPEILKTKLVSFAGTEYKHATLGDVTKAVVDALARHGFSHSWETKQNAGLISVTCKITHRLGHSESTGMEAAPDNSGKKNLIQQVASSITYMQRYTLLAACGLATMDEPDDDGGQAYESAFDAADWCNKAQACESVAALKVLWEHAGSEATKAKDRGGYSLVRVAVAERKAELEKQEVAQ